MRIDHPELRHGSRQRHMMFVVISRCGIVVPERGTGNEQKNHSQSQTSKYLLVHIGYSSQAIPLLVAIISQAPVRRFFRQAPRVSSDPASSSEYQLQRQLDLPRGVERATDLSGTVAGFFVLAPARKDTPLRPLEVRPVQEIEKLRAKFELPRLAEIMSQLAYRKAGVQGKGVCGPVGER